MYLPCLLPPTQAFIFCSLDSYYPWVIRGEEACRWLRRVVFPIPMLLWYILFLKIFQRVFPVETPFLIQFSFPFLYHVSRKGPAKGWPAASASSMIPCIQSLVPFLFLYSWVLLACQAFLWSGQRNRSARPAVFCLLHETLADCFSRSDFTLFCPW